jgi:hypothetical protein
MIEAEAPGSISAPGNKPLPFADQRAAAGLSIADAAQEFGVPLATIAEWDHGTATPPSHVLRSLEMIGRFGVESRETAAFKAPQSSTAPMPTPKAAPNSMSASSDLIKSKQRVADHGEVFTPPWLVEKMLDLVKGETERIDSRFLEPACGSGNFLVPILQRKLAAVEARYGKTEFEKHHYLNHAFWFLPSVAACEAMKNLLEEKQNVFWHKYAVIVAAGTDAGIGLAALKPVRDAIGSGHETQTIILSCGKLTTGVTVPQWSSILMLRNLKSPETYFQAAFRVQSPWSIKNPDGDDPNREDVLKPVCFVFDFAPTRALRQISEYGIGLSPGEQNPEKAVADLVSFLPVLAYDGANMVQIDAGGILDIAMAGTSATLLARKWESAMLVNVDNDTLRRVLANAEAMAAVERIEGWRNLGDNVIETIINKSEKIKDIKKKAKEADLSEKEKKELTAEEKEYKSLRKKVQEKLIKFATRIPAFMYLTDFRENTLVDVITKIEPDLFRTVTGLTVGDFNLLVDLKVFNTERMNAAVFAFKRYEDASLRYTGIDSHDGLTQIGGYNTVIAKEVTQ